MCDIRKVMAGTTDAFCSQILWTKNPPLPVHTMRKSTISHRLLKYACLNDLHTVVELFLTSYKMFFAKAIFREVLKIAFARNIL